MANPDDGSLQFVRWPYLSPYDFVTWLHGIFGEIFWVSFIVSTWFTRFTGRPCPHQVSALLSMGFIDALVADFGCLEAYWRGMLGDFPTHPVASKNCRNCVGCTLY